MPGNECNRSSEPSPDHTTDTSPPSPLPWPASAAIPATACPVPLRRLPPVPSLKKTESPSASPLRTLSQYGLLYFPHRFARPIPLYVHIALHRKHRSSMHQVCTKQCTAPENSAYAPPRLLHQPCQVPFFQYCP